MTNGRTLASGRLQPLRGTGPSRLRPEQRTALLWFGAFGLVALGVWAVAVLGGARGSEVHAPAPVLAQDTDQDTDRDTDRQADPETTTGDAADTDRAESGAATGSTDDTGSDDGQDAGAAADGADGSADDASDDPPADDREGEPSTVTVVLDDVCEVETSTAERDAVAAAPAWTHDDCSYAPVAVARSEPAWVVVRASMNGDDFTAEDARARAADLGATGGVLWSTHYPSLNPNLWVVYDGPFPGRDAARRAAVAAGGGAYARTLSVDDADRFCIAADGCVGERAD